MVFAVGALGSAAAIAFAARTRNLAHARRQAVAALQSTGANLFATPCAAITGGAATVAGVDVRWTAQRVDSIVRVTLEAQHRGTVSTLRVEVPCA